MSEQHSEISNLPGTAQPVLGYATFVAAVKNPVSVAAIVCVALPICILGGVAWIPGFGWFYEADCVLGLFGILAVTFGAIGIWLSREPTRPVAGQSLGWIAILSGTLEIGLSVMLTIFHLY
jgi:hypothetical protein